MWRHGLSTFSWEFGQGATTPPTPSLRHSLVKFRRVPPSPPPRQQEAVDGPLHVHDVTVTS